jgi:hypothetical protein
MKIEIVLSESINEKVRIPNRLGVRTFSFLNMP